MEEFKETASYSAVAVFKECKKEKLKREGRRGRGGHGVKHVTDGSLTEMQARFHSCQN